MGDRVLFQVYKRAELDRQIEFSPVIYGHWSGSRTPEICRKLAERMKGRAGDVQYTAARLVQELIGEEGGQLGFGIWNAEALLSEEDSHGDAGVVRVEAYSGGLAFECLGGYLALGPDGLPTYLRAVQALCS